MTIVSIPCCSLTVRVLWLRHPGSAGVKFVVREVPTTPERPRGVTYSLTLHDENGERLLGFDNAHSVREGSGPGSRTRIEYDHKHLGVRVRFYDYADAAQLLTDFWFEVDAILSKRRDAP